MDRHQKPRKYLPPRTSLLSAAVRLPVGLNEYECCQVLNGSHQLFLYRRSLPISVETIGMINITYPFGLAPTHPPPPQSCRNKNVSSYTPGRGRSNQVEVIRSCVD